MEIFIEFTAPTLLFVIVSLACAAYVFFRPLFVVKSSQWTMAMFAGLALVTAALLFIDPLYGLVLYEHIWFADIFLLIGFVLPTVFMSAIVASASLCLASFRSFSQPSAQRPVEAQAPAQFHQSTLPMIVSYVELAVAIFLPVIHIFAIVATGHDRTLQPFVWISIISCSTLAAAGVLTMIIARKPLWPAIVATEAALSFTLSSAALPFIFERLLR